MRTHVYLRHLVEKYDAVAWSVTHYQEFSVVSLVLSGGRVRNIELAKGCQLIEMASEEEDRT